MVEVYLTVILHSKKIWAVPAFIAKLITLHFQSQMFIFLFQILQKLNGIRILLYSMLLCQKILKTISIYVSF